MRRRLAALLLAVAVAFAAGCGGSSGDDATRATTAAPPPADDLGARLPPVDAVPGVGPGTTRDAPTARALVDALYRRSEPTRDPALARLRAAGYAGGVVRDQQGADPEAGAALVRSYAFRLRDDEAARAEVEAAVDEAAASPDARDPQPVEVPGVEGAAGLRAGVAEGGVAGRVIIVTFPQGPYVQGVQAVALEGATLPEDDVIRAAQELAARIGAG